MFTSVVGTPLRNNGQPSHSFSFFRDVDKGRATITGEERAKGNATLQESLSIKAYVPL